MNQTTCYRWCRGVIFLGLLITGFGCASPASLLWFLNKGDGKVPATYKLEPTAGKKEITVAVVVSTNPSLTLSSAMYAGLDTELAHHIANTLTSETKDAKVKILVVEHSKVNQMKAANPTQWDTGNRSEQAKRLGADYLLDVYVDKFKLDNREFARELTVGQASLSVAVYRAGNNVEPLFNYPIESKPELDTIRTPNPISYRQLYVRQLGQQIAHKHINHIPARDRSMEQ